MGDGGEENGHKICSVTSLTILRHRRDLPPRASPAGRPAMTLPPSAGAVVFDGSEVARFSDWEYIPDIIDGPGRVYEALSRELGFDPHTGLPGDETLFQPPEARLVLRYGKKHEMPFRQAFVALRAGLCEPKLGGKNRSLLERPDLQPVHDIARCPTLLMLQREVSVRLGLEGRFLNYCNINLYEAGARGRLGAHEDQDHGDARSHVVAASLTLEPDVQRRPRDARGRVYVLRRKGTNKIKVLKATLRNGALTVLGRRVNAEHTHELAVQQKAIPRLSLNFRHVPDPSS